MNLIINSSTPILILIFTPFHRENMRLSWVTEPDQLVRGRLGLAAGLSLELGCATFPPFQVPESTDVGPRDRSPGGHPQLSNRKINITSRLVGDRIAKCITPDT